VPQVPGPPTPEFICTFNQTTSAGVDLAKPAVTVSPFPAPGQTTLSALSSTLSSYGEAILNRPQWGHGAFMTNDKNSQSTSVEVDLFLPSYHVLIHLPSEFAANSTDIGDRIGNAAAG
jgi:hypothetical protein